MYTYTLSIIHGLKHKHIPCETFGKAKTLASLYWYKEPVIIDNATNRPVYFDLNVPGTAESEY